METANEQTRISIYVACLAAYNNGILHGAWIDAAQDAGGIMADIRTMLKASPEPCAEEWAIHDYEGFSGLELSEYMGVAQVAALAGFIEEHGKLGAELLAHAGDIEAARAMLDDDYAGEYRSLAEFAQDMTESGGDVPQHLRYYIDYESMARDMAIDSVFTITTGFEQTHVFWQR